MNVIFCEECGGRNSVTPEQMAQCDKHPPVCTICGNVMAPETIISYDGAAAGSPRAVDTSQYHLLVIDDDAFYLEMARTVLGRDYQITTAGSGEEGIRLASEQKPDLVLLDVEMPGMDGYETCLKFKNDTKLRHIPVLFVSASSGNENEYRGLELGAVDYIHKPLQLDVLNARIGLQLRLKQLLEKEKAQQKKIRESLQQFTLLAEQEQETITQERNNLRAILNSMSEMVTMENVEKKILWANQSTLNFLNLTPSEVLGRYCYEVFSGGDKVCLQCPFENGSGQDVGKPVTISRQAEDAPPLEQIHIPLYNDEGELTGAAHVVKEKTAWLI